MTSRIYSKTHHDWYQVIKCTDVFSQQVKHLLTQIKVFPHGGPKALRDDVHSALKKQVCTWYILAVKVLSGVEVFYFSTT